MLTRIFFILIWVCFPSTTSNDEAISWSDDFKLTWSHFKGSPQQNVDAVAVTASGITFEFSLQEADGRPVSFNTKVYAHFYPKKSWYIKEQSTDYILAHEQLHFDITELYVRKFRQQISRLKVSNSLKSELRELHLNINKEVAVTQNLYDQETDNSRNVESQLKWNLFVKQELDKLKDFKSKD